MGFSFFVVVSSASYFEKGDADASVNETTESQLLGRLCGNKTVIILWSL